MMFFRFSDRWRKFPGVSWISLFCETGEVLPQERRKESVWNANDVTLPDAGGRI